MVERLHYLNVCKALDKELIVECINKGLEKSLGSSKAKDLALKTLKVVYGLDEIDISSSSLDTLESVLMNVFGESAARVILNDIANECKMLYS